MVDNLDTVAKYKEAIEAMLEVEELEQLKDVIKSFDKDQEDLSKCCDEIDSVREKENEVDKLSSEILEYTEKLKLATQSLEELSVPLDYSDRRRVDMFRRAFGLEFKVTEDRVIVFSFFNLCQTDPNRRCAITMDIEDEQWKVVHMDPVLHGVKALLDQLNSGGQLKTFCQQIRQKFKDHLSEELKD